MPDTDYGGTFSKGGIKRYQWKAIEIICFPLADYIHLNPLRAKMIKEGYGHA